MSVDFPQRHKVCFVNFRIWQAMRVAIHTQIRQAMRVLIHTHISCRLLVEGSAPKPLEHRISFCGCAFCERFRQAMRVLIHTHISCRLLVEGSAPKPLEHRISFCGCAFCERFERVRQSAVPFQMPWNKSFPPYCLMAAVKHSSPQ